MNPKNIFNRQLFISFFISFLIFMFFGCATPGEKVDDHFLLNNLTGEWKGSWISSSNPGYSGKVSLNIKSINDGILDINGFLDGGDCGNSTKVKGSMEGSWLIVVFERQQTNCGNNTYQLEMRADKEKNLFLIGKYKSDAGYYGSAKLSIKH